MLIEPIKSQEDAGELKVSVALNRKGRGSSTDAGFSLLETSAAMVVFLIATLGVYTTFTYSVNYNAGNSTRAMSLAILQEKVEQMRSLKFTPGKTDPELTGGVKTPEILSAVDGNTYRIQTTVDDDPFTSGIQTDSTKTLKEINVTVTLDRPSPGWQTAVPATIILRRVRGN